MNSFAFVLLSLAAIATAAPGGWRCGRSPGWCKNKGKSSSGQAGRRTAAPETIVSKAIATPALSTLVTPSKLLVWSKHSAVREISLYLLQQTTHSPRFQKQPSMACWQTTDALTAVLLRHVLPNRIM